MLNLAVEFERQGIGPRQSSLGVGIFWAELWTEATHVEIESRISITAIDIYGLSEAIGPGVAVECIETKDGQRCGRITSILKSLIWPLVNRYRMERWVSWCSPL